MSPGRTFKSFFIGVGLFFIVLFSAGCTSTPLPNKQVTLIKIPDPLFEIDQTRSPAKRKNRRSSWFYDGPLIDTHIHLDPPQNKTYQADFFQNMIEDFKINNVIAVAVMPVPNEGHMIKRIGTSGNSARNKLRIKNKKIAHLMCGSDYITNWLQDAFQNGYQVKTFDKIKEKLAADLNNPNCSGIGEIGLYHFNKTGHQHVNQYPPGFKPFLAIIDQIAKSGKWLDFHAEPVSPENESYEKSVFGLIEHIYQKYPDFKLILSHTAMTNPANARNLLQTYPNMMMNFKIIKKHKLWRNLEPITNSKGRIYEDWATLFETQPRRFMIGTDEKFGRLARGAIQKEGTMLAKYGKKINGIRKLLGSLDPKTAEFIAYKNALRVFNWEVKR
jgi:hypothetical protein